MRTKIQPLFKWTGSKQRMLDAYVPYFFPATSPTRFVDLFAGALTITLWVHETYPKCELIINDVNVELIDLYRILASDTEAVITEWRRHVTTWLSYTNKQTTSVLSGSKKLQMPVYVHERRLYYNTLLTSYAHEYATLNPIVRVAMLLFMLQTNFNGMWKNYHKYHKHYSTPPGSCHQSAVFFDEQNIRDVATVLRRATIISGPYANVPVQSGDFIYADPPYRNSIVTYDVPFDDNAQIALARYLMAHDGPFAYSNKKISATDMFYETHFPNVPCIEIDSIYKVSSTSQKLDVTEVLIIRDPDPHRVISQPIAETTLF